MLMPPIFWTQKQDIGPSGRLGHGMACDAARQRVVVFGGDPGGPPLADTWNWDGSLWTQIADTGPSARHSVALADDPAAQRVVLFGGASGTTSLGDTWTFDGTEWTQVADTGPQARSGHALAYDGARQRLVLFGGEAGGPLADTWEWSSLEWTQVQDVGPSARRGHAMAFDPSLGRVVLFGGAGADGTGLNDTWAWDGTSWTQVADTGPDARVRAGMVGTGSVLLFGGLNSIDTALAPASRVVFGDSWRWDGEAWTKVQDIGPAPRWGHGMAFRTAAGRIALFGGGTVFAAAEEGSLVPGLRRDTWEVADAAAQPGGGTQPGAVEVASVEVNPTSVMAVGADGEALQVTVFLTAPATPGMSLVMGIFVNDNQNWTPVEPPGFVLPTVGFNGGEGSSMFSIVRDPTPLMPGEYAIGVGVAGGGSMQGGFFTVV
jgi:hypothetical protein